MKRIGQLLTVAGLGSALLLSTGNLMAQDNPPPGGPPGDRGRGGRGGNFDPAQFQQQRLERAKERLEIAKDDEWSAIQPLVQKVFDAQRDVMALSLGRGFGRGPRPGGDNNSGGDQGSRRGGGFFGEPSAEVQALEKAIQDKAPKKDLEAALAKFRAVKKDKEAKLKDAQDALRKVLSTRQEAIAVANNYLD